MKATVVGLPCASSPLCSWPGHSQCGAGAAGTSPGAARPLHGLQPAPWGLGAWHSAHLRSSAQHPEFLSKQSSAGRAGADGRGAQGVA